MNELLKDRQEIIAWLDKSRIKNYTLIKDDTYSFVVDVDGDVDLGYSQLDSIEVKFNAVSGNFLCMHNVLTSLLGAPKSVGMNFDCSSNWLTTLEYCPTSIGNNFFCDANRLTTLLHCPASIDGRFDCSSNNLTSLQHCPQSVTGFFDCSRNKIVDLDFLPQVVGSDFYCEHNVAFKEFGKICDFDFIKDKITSDREKLLLAASIYSNNTTNIHKV